MKTLRPIIPLMMLLPWFSGTPSSPNFQTGPLPRATRLVVVTIDGLRWQEVFGGADPDLLYNERWTRDTATAALLFGGQDEQQRREKLMPFTWSVLARRGQLYGNRRYGNRCDVLNSAALSYPGYNEILSGHADERIRGNHRRYNPNTTVLEYLHHHTSFRGSVAAFTSWDLFPYILNTPRSGLRLNSGYASLADSGSGSRLINTIQEACVEEKESTRYDALTWLAAREYLRTHQPRVLFLGLGETDEQAHEGHYDDYLQKANEADHIIAELWNWIQRTPGYRDQTILLVTTDHGRGRNARRWTVHGPGIAGSSETWMAVMGPGLSSEGEIKKPGQFYQAQLARTMAGILGTDFAPEAAAPPLALALKAR